MGKMGQEVNSNYLIGDNLFLEGPRSLQVPKLF
jgi:hypothetical protein